MVKIVWIVPWGSPSRRDELHLSSAYHENRRDNVTAEIHLPLRAGPLPLNTQSVGLECSAGARAELRRRRVRTAPEGKSFWDECPAFRTAPLLTMSFPMAGWWLLSDAAHNECRGSRSAWVLVAACRQKGRSSYSGSLSPRTRIRRSVWPTDAAWQAASQAGVASMKAPVSGSASEASALPAQLAALDAAFQASSMVALHAAVAASRADPDSAESQKPEIGRASCRE